MKKLIEFLDSDILKIACVVFAAALPFVAVVLQVKFPVELMFFLMSFALVLLCASIAVSVYNEEKKYRF